MQKSSIDARQVPANSELARDQTRSAVAWHSRRASAPSIVTTLRSVTTSRPSIHTSVTSLPLAL